MRTTFTMIFLAVTFVAACGNSSSTGVDGGGSDTPTNAYKALFAAVKSKDTEAIKQAMTKKTQEFAQFSADRQKATLEKVLANGFTKTTFAETLPEIRDERVSENMGAIEVWNAEDKIWEDLPFIKEDGVWKLAVGELFDGSFKSPGKGRAKKEAEAANLMNTPVPAGNNLAGANAPKNTLKNLEVNNTKPPANAKPLSANSNTNAKP